MVDALLQRLQEFRFGDAGASLTFAGRLARENGWSRAFAERVLDEYRRFLWLCVRAGHPVTPSPAVDEAWHLHLSYTRSYWDELCGGVLGRPLHHEPTRGGAAEGEKFADWYARTLASYRRHFGEPPVDLWPPVAARFRGDSVRKVDARSHWIVAKRLPRRAVAAAVATSGLLLCTGCAVLAASDAAYVVGVVFCVVVVVAIVAGVRAMRTRRRDDEGGSACGAACGAGGGGAKGGDSGCGGSAGSGCGGSGCGGGGSD